LAVAVILGASLKGNGYTVIILVQLWTTIEQNNNAKPEWLSLWVRTRGKESDSPIMKLSQPIMKEFAAQTW
jgi:hypothetical protein